MGDFVKKFKLFGINKEDIPQYSEPENFAKKFERCTIYEYGNISYSSTTKLVTPQESNKKNA